jgi:hypothetical protein
LQAPGFSTIECAMRSFPFRHQARLLKIDVVAIDEGWELWVAEDERRLACGGRITVDQAMAGWRVGEDRVLELAEEVKSNVLTGKLAVNRPAVTVASGGGPAETAPSP